MAHKLILPDCRENEPLHSNMEHKLILPGCRKNLPCHANMEHTLLISACREAFLMKKLICLHVYVICTEVRCLSAFSDTCTWQ